MKECAVIARVPFDEGTLTGTLTLDSTWPAGDWRNTYFVPENLKSSVEHAEALRPLVPAGDTMAEMALRFILNNPRCEHDHSGDAKLKNDGQTFRRGKQAGCPRSCARNCGRIGGTAIRRRGRNNRGTHERQHKSGDLSPDVPIQGDLDEVYIRRIASYVDEKMRAISEMASTIDTQKVAVLAALAIAG
jgi:hypothetical protein